MLHREIASSSGSAKWTNLERIGRRARTVDLPSLQRSQGSNSQWGLLVVYRLVEESVLRSNLEHLSAAVPTVETTSIVRPSWITFSPMVGILPSRW